MDFTFGFYVGTICGIGNGPITSITLSPFQVTNETLNTSGLANGCSITGHSIAIGLQDSIHYH